MLYNGQLPQLEIFLFCWLSSLLKSLKVLKQPFLGLTASPLCQDITYFTFRIKTFCFSHKIEEVLRDRFVSPKFPFWSLPPQCQLTLSPNLPACPLPGAAMFKRDLKSLGSQQGGNEYSLFSWKSFATSCGKCRGCSVHFQFSLVAGPLLGNGKLTVPLVTKWSLTRGLHRALQRH